MALTVQCLINGNASVTNYRVFYRALSEAWSSIVVTKALPIEVSDLILLAKYEFKVSAGNEHGYGPNSSTIEVQTAEGGTWRLVHVLCCIGTSTVICLQLRLLL